MSKYGRGMAARVNFGLMNSLIMPLLMYSTVRAIIWKVWNRNWPSLTVGLLTHHAAALISFTARRPESSAPCIHEDHGERCSPAKWMRPSGEDPAMKSLGPTNAHAPRDHSSSIQHLLAAPSKFSRRPGYILSSWAIVELMRSASFMFAIGSAWPGRL